MNKACEALVVSYGELQECTPEQQAEKKTQFDSALNKFAQSAGCPPEVLRAFVIRKWHELNAAEAKRKAGGVAGGLRPADRDDPNQGRLSLS